MDHSVADGADIGDFVEDADFRVGEDPQHPLDRGPVFEDLAIISLSLAVGDLEYEARIGEADLLDQTGSQSLVLVGFHPLEVGVDDLELDRRLSTVENEDFHWFNSIAAVTAR